MKTVAFASALLLASVPMVDSGYAASVTYNIKGTVSAVQDLTSYFDPGLIGQAFSASIVFNLEDASIDSAVNSTLVSNSQNQTLLPGSASFSVGATIYDFSIYYYTLQTALNTGSTPSTIINALSSPNSYNFEYLYFQLNSINLSNGISPMPETPIEGFIGNYQHNFGDSTTGSQYSLLFLTPTSLEIVTDVSAVPLPASLPMFGASLLGLGALGYGVRRRARAATLKSDPAL